MSVNVPPTHDMAELIGSRMLGITTVSPREQRRMVTAACIEAAKMYNAALATRDARIRELEAALKPFAAMHREEYTKDEIVLMRGIEEDMTVLHSHDFANAAAALAAKDKP